LARGVVPGIQYLNAGGYFNPRFLVYRAVRGIQKSGKKI
jgi:hypothetical protein